MGSSKVSGGKVTADLLSKAMPNSVSGWFTQNLSKNFWAGQAKSFVEEGLEEVESDLLNPLIKSIYNGKSVGENYSNKDNISVESLTHSFLMGGISTLVLGGKDVADYARYGKNVYETRVSMQDNIDAFNDVAKMFDKETLYQKDAEGNVIIDEDNAPVMTKEGAAAMTKFTETKSEYDKSLDKLTQKEKANFLKQITGTDINSMIEVDKKSMESNISLIDNQIAELNAKQDSEGFSNETQNAILKLYKYKQAASNQLNEAKTNAEIYKNSYIKDTISEITKDYDINNLSKRAIDDIASRVKEAGFDVNIREAKSAKEFNSYFNKSNASTAQNSSDYDMLGAAIFDPNTNTILVNPDVKYNRTKTIAHELTHTIQSNKNSWQYIYSSFNKNSNSLMSKTWKDIVKGNKGLYGNNTREIKNESVAEMVEKIIDNPKKFKSLLSYTQKSKIGKALADLFNRNKEDKVIKRAYSEFLNADKENKNQDYIEAKSRKTNKGDVKSSYEQTNEFRKLQETSRMLSSREVRAYNSGSKVFNEGLRKYLTDVFRRQIKRSSSGNAHSTRILNFQNKVVAKYEMVEEVNGELYHDIFEIAQKYLKFGDAVTVHKASYYNETKNYISDNGLSGFSITSNGDLVSVYSLQHDFLKTVGSYMLEKGAVSLDCYKIKNHELNEMYSRFLGFKQASFMPFNYDVLKEDMGKEYADYFVRTFGKPPVYFMVRSDVNVELKEFREDEYDKAKDYRDSFLPENIQAKTIKNKKASNNTNEDSKKDIVLIDNNESKKINLVEQNKIIDKWLNTFESSNSRISSGYNKIKTYFVLKDFLEMENSRVFEKAKDFLSSVDKTISEITKTTETINKKTFETEYGQMSDENLALFKKYSKAKQLATSLVKLESIYKANESYKTYIAKQQEISDKSKKNIELKDNKQNVDLKDNKEKSLLISTNEKVAQEESNKTY